MWSRRFFSICFFFSGSNRSVESVGLRELSAWVWEASGQYSVPLCHYTLKRHAQVLQVQQVLPIHSPAVSLNQLDPASLGIWSFQIKLYLPQVIINLQFSPWLSCRNVHNEKLFRKTGREEMEICPLQCFSHLWPLCLKLYCSVVHFIPCFPCQFSAYWNKTFSLIQRRWFEQLMPISIWVIGSPLQAMKQLLVLAGKEYS